MDQYAFSAGDIQGASPFERVADGDALYWRGLRRCILAASSRAEDGFEEAGAMMSGCVDYPVRAASPKTRRYEVIARGGGWSITINGACTRPFRNRRGAERIARVLQRQADALAHEPLPTAKDRERR